MTVQVAPINTIILCMSLFNHVLSRDTLRQDAISSFKIVLLLQARITLLMDICAPANLEITETFYMV